MHSLPVCRLNTALHGTLVKVNPRSTVQLTLPPCSRWLLHKFGQHGAPLWLSKSRWAQSWNSHEMLNAVDLLLGMSVSRSDEPLTGSNWQKLIEFCVLSNHTQVCVCVCVCVRVCVCVLGRGGEGSQRRTRAVVHSGSVQVWQGVAAGWARRHCGLQ